MNSDSISGFGPVGTNSTQESAEDVIAEIRSHARSLRLWSNHDAADLLDGWADRLEQAK